MTIRKFMKHEKLNITLLLTLLLGFISSCQEDYQTIVTEGTTGRLSLGISVEAEVSDISTRGTVIAPSLQDLTITITNTTTSEETSLTASQTEVVLEVGRYVIEAVYGENVCSISPYYYGKKEFVIEQGKTTNVNLTSALVSAVIHPSASDDLLSYYKSYQFTVLYGETSYTIVNEADFFVPANTNYILTFSGVNKFDENKSNSWNLNSLIRKTRYTINCNLDLPSFTLPEQVVGNAWSKFIYITPMTADNMTSGLTATDRVISNVVYEASADGSNWYTSIVENGRITIKGLQPSTTYTIRSKFMDILSSNTQILTTENAQQIAGGNMDSWTYTDGKDGNWKLWYPRSTKDEATIPGWCTINSYTAKDNNSRAYCSNSGTEQTTDSKSGYAAEIKTIGWGDGSTAAGGASIIYNITPGQLFLGKIADVTNPDYYFQFNTRPVKLSFYCKYIRKGTRQYSVTCKVYNSNKELLGEQVFTEGAVDTYQKREITLNYSTIDTKASYITLIFESGENSHSELDKGSISRKSRHTGNKLYIDDIEIIYE